jgi:hypothetical protein
MSTIGEKVREITVVPVEVPVPRREEVPDASPLEQPVAQPEETPAARPSTRE